MAMLMMLGEVQPDAEAHEHASGNELAGDRLAQQHDGDGRPQERRH